ncbi:glycosyltransferase family 4 protein [Peteryoungia desertarenae]|uniref:Glycosyltransferase family 4 protein n=1 Tax=Peteryoungia desertarenae TaxID=1813451 RepID=A0ABX6QNG7_9HYPH|nr:glycosyltransferase family 4 protein [Peteryoungia desertarenae]QLF70070.1 glycosyltransferase family 4 protein [Peteryoungia desertarenae]
MQPDGPLRILHCFRSPVGGIFRHVRDLAEQHSRLGHQVGIICDSSTGGAHEDKLFEHIMPFLSLGLTRLRIDRAISLRDIPALTGSYKQIKELQPDVLHGHGAKGGVVARLVGSALRVKRYRVARFYSPHGGSLHFSRRTAAGQIVLRIERQLERLTDGLCFVCDYERETYSKKVGIPRCDAERIYNGIGEQDFQLVPVAPDAVDFIYVGMLRDLKGPDVFIEAFAKAERIVGRPLTGLIIGDGPDQAKYQRLLETKGLGRRVGILPAMPIHEAFAKSAILVVPSRAEAMPYIVLEAIGAGKTVIASRVGGVPEILGRNSKALVPPGDPTELANAMAHAITVPGWSDGVIPNRELFLQKFATTTMAKDLEAFYRRKLFTR